MVGSPVGKLSSRRCCCSCECCYTLHSRSTGQPLAPGSLRITHQTTAPLPPPPRSDLLSGTRSSRLYRSLILGGKALTASAYASYPADKYPATFSLYSIPAKGG